MTSSLSSNNCLFCFPNATIVCNHEARDNNFNQGQIPWCTVSMLLVCISICLKSGKRYKFLILHACYPHTIFTWGRMWGSVVIIRNQIGSASKEIWETLDYWQFRNIFVIHSKCLNLYRRRTDCFIQRPNSYSAVNTFYLGYKNQSVYAVSGTNRCLFSGKYKTHKYSVGRAYSCWMLNLLVHHVNCRL